MRRGIASIPDGDYTAEDFLDEDGVTDEPIPVNVTVKVRGDSMEIDFSGSGRQPLGNCGTAWCEASRCIEAVKLMVDPSTPVNSGTLRRSRLCCRPAAWCRFCRRRVAPTTPTLARGDQRRHPGTEPGDGRGIRL